jgi:ABC-type multidrug transport system ATPase subunit
MTTHSMEEVDALATRVGIIASRMLAVGTPASLKDRFATYEIHLAAEAVHPLVSILREKGFTNARPSEDTSTRISIPGITEHELSALLRVMEIAQRQMDGAEMTLHE